MSLEKRSNGKAGSESVPSTRCSRQPWATLFRFRALLGRFAGSRLALGQFLAIEITNDLGHIRPGFRIRRNTSVLFYPVWPGIVGGQGFGEIVVVVVQQPTQVPGSTFNVCLRIECVGDPQRG